jgi:hypothetical protein
MQLVACRGGIDIRVISPAANEEYGGFPIDVTLEMNVTEGLEADRLRVDPGAYTACYGLREGVQVACFGFGDPIMMTPGLEARHLLSDTYQKHYPGSKIGVHFEAWVERWSEGVRVENVTVAFTVQISEAVRKSESPAFLGSCIESESSDMTHDRERKHMELERRGYTIIPTLVVIKKMVPSRMQFVLTEISIDLLFVASTVAFSHENAL